MSSPEVNGRQNKEWDGFVDDPIRTLSEIYRTYGERGNILARDQRLLCVFAPAVHQEVLSNPAVFYTLGYSLPGPRHSPIRRLASGLHNVNGVEWKDRRRNLMEPLKRGALDSYHKSIIELADQMLSTWCHGQSRDIYHEMHEFMLRVTSGIVFGVEQPEIAYAAGRLTAQCLQLNSELFRPGTVWANGDPSKYESLLAAAERLEAHLLNMLEQRRLNPRGNDVISVLLRMAGQEARVMDAAAIGDIAFLFAAAHRTTTTALTWTLFLLAQHPRIAAELLDELDVVLDGHAPRADQLDALCLLDRVIKESMRLLPPIVFMNRFNVEPVKLAGNLLPRGIHILLSQYITHRMPNLYHHPARFLPDRWLTTHRSHYEYLPFGAGPRFCLGATLSIMVLKTALAMTLQRYRLAVVPGARIDRHVSFVLEPKAGMPMLIYDQDRRFERTEVAGDILEMVDFGAGKFL